jgi:ATP-binding cassette subfamily B protein
MVNMFQSAAASAERVFAILDEPSEIPDPENAKVVEDVRGKVTFDNMDFTYSPDVKLIEDFNLQVEPGKTIAIVGPTGAGKTTLVNLLMRFYDPQKGQITVDGVDTRQITRHSLRKHIGMVLQDVWLFSGTIEENLRYGIPEGVVMEEPDFLDITKATYVDPIIRKLPESYQTKITNENDSLSEGEKQLLTIARASLSNPDILILDEATSSVDTRTEVLVQKAMNKLMEGRTSFVIAHRLSTIRGADIILMLENGSIVEQGNHDDLIALNGHYAALYNAQFAGVET